MDKASEMGPLVTKEHLERVKGYVDLGVEDGAKLVVDGRDLKLQGYENGFYTVSYTHLTLPTIFSV